MDIETGAETSHFLHSTLRERIVEHVFVGDALRRLWQHGVTDVEVLRSEFDAGGYDLVIFNSKPQWLTARRLVSKPASS
jgi:hypothetical protein